jgi:hypothetical protein
MSAVEFELAEDGAHVLWRHGCLEWGPLDADLALAMLPVGAKWWTVEQEEPLTVFPSIKCRRCGLHGWIRNGKWEVAR